MLPLLFVLRCVGCETINLSTTWKKIFYLMHKNGFAFRALFVIRFFLLFTTKFSMTWQNMTKTGRWDSIAFVASWQSNRTRLMRHLWLSLVEDSSLFNKMFYKVKLLIDFSHEVSRNAHVFFLCQMIQFKLFFFCSVSGKMKISMHISKFS